MNYEEFKEQIVEDVKQELENRGMGHTGFIVMCNRKKIIRTGDSRFIA